MTDAVEPGLRERKRRATRRAIEAAAVRVALARGLDGATVEEIARVADVSPRTFFNYFPTKEDAVLGNGPVLDDGAVVAAFVEGRGPVIDDLEQLVTACIPGALSDADLVQLRRRLTKQHPDLTARRMARLHEFEQQLIDVIGTRLEAEAPGEAEEHRRSRARLIGLVALAAIRHGWGNWVEHGRTAADLTSEVRASMAELRAVVASATRRTVG